MQTDSLAAFIAGWYAVLSLAAFAAYGVDKSAARRHANRISERTLHLLGLAGGWPGALAAQLLLRHKSRKRSFLAMFWLTVVVNGAVFVALMAFMVAS